MRKGPNPKVFMLMAAGAFAVGGLLAFTGYNNLSSSMSDLQKLQGQAKNASMLQKELADSQASLQDSVHKLQYLETGVQDYAYVPTMLSDLDKLGRQSGINVVGVRPIPKETRNKDASADAESARKKPYDELDLEVKGQGTYRAVLNFIGALGKFPKIVAARTVQLDPKSTPGQNTSILDVTIGLRAYVFPTPVAPPPSKNTAMASGSTHEG